MTVLDPNRNLNVDWVVLDVGGEKFHARKNIFLDFPGTRLGKVMTSKTIEQILTFCDEYTPCDPPEYFFDHNPETFPGWFYLLKQRECPIQIKENLMKFMQVPNF